MAERHGRWHWIFVGAASLFLILAAIAWVAGVPAIERQVYHAIRGVVPTTTISHDITRLGSKNLLFPCAALLIILLPWAGLRRWWLWLAVLVLASALEGPGKGIVGRPRPESLRSGFPSGHTAMAAAFYFMAAYFAAGPLRHPAARYGVYGLGVSVILLVGLSRIALQMHWPLDVLGGLALGIALVAGAAWWHERHPATGHRPFASIPPAFRGWLYRWQTLIPIPFFAVLLFTPPLGADDSLLDILFDVFGSGFTAVGLLLRLWVASHAGRQTVVPARLPATLVATGPFSLMRHPLAAANLLIGLGIMLLAESGPGLILIPAVLILMYRITAPFEEAQLSHQLGASYAEYCRSVPRVPRLSPAMLNGALFRPSWRSLAQELPAVLTTLGLAVLAERADLLPRLLP